MKKMNPKYGIGIKLSTMEIFLAEHEQTSH
jgi:hypothetical protein